MTATQLMADLTGLGIRLEAHGDRLRYAPRSAVTPDLADQMKVHKPELLEMLRVDGNEPNIDPTNVTSVWQAALDQLEGDPLFPPDVMNALRAANVHWASDESPVRPTDDSKSIDLGPDGWPVNSIDPDELEPCSKCGTLELWQTHAGNWRCQRCDPPTKAQRVRGQVERIRQGKSLGPVSGDVTEAENEFYWKHISKADYEYLTGPRNWPDPCPWCGGRLIHAKMCDELHRSWAPVWPWGKHKGHKLVDISTDYFRYFIKKGFLKGDLAENVRRELDSREKTRKDERATDMDIASGEGSR